MTNEIEAVLRSPIIHRQIKSWLRDALEMDPVDALGDAEMLVEILAKREAGRCQN